MKKYILILLAVFTALLADAQQIDKDLLYGRWSLYSIQMGNVFMCSDSFDRTMTSMLEAYLAENPEGVVTQEDSIEIKQKLPIILSELEKSYVEFNRSGKAKAHFSMEDEEDEDIQRSFTWLNDREITIAKDGDAYTQLKILSLTANKLVVTKVEKVSAVENVVVFTKN